MGLSIKETAKRLLSVKNPLAVQRRKKMREALTNTNPTFLCPNCIGGILFHDLGLRFCSPTVNLMMFQKDFVEFVLNMDDYLGRDLVFYNDKDYDCPCARFSSSEVTVHFTHYHSEEESIQKWIERSARINRENLFIFLEERDGLSREDILRLKNIHARGLVVFTANSYPDIPYALQISKYSSNGEVGNILATSYLDDSREYEKYFDFVKWFNEANGDFDITSFIK